MNITFDVMFGETWILFYPVVGSALGCNRSYEEIKRKNLLLQTK